MFKRILIMIMIGRRRKMERSGSRTRRLLLMTMTRWKIIMRKMRTMVMVADCVTP